MNWHLYNQIIWNIEVGDSLYVWVLDIFNYGLPVLHPTIYLYGMDTNVVMYL
jgi:hypothetical protein